MYKQVKKITDMHLYSNPESGYEKGFNEGVEVCMRVLYMQEVSEFGWHHINNEVPKQEFEHVTNRLRPSKYCFTYDCNTKTFGVSRYFEGTFVDVQNWDAHSPTHWKYADIEPPEGF